ncbi:MAG TPA: ABC transporter permease [Gemmatimonadales bacterium]|nr:ABC transporter permease [Gemmatimonadales bacterium]
MTSWHSRLARRLRALFRAREVDRELDAEIRLHVELETEELMQRDGLTREEARRRALVAFGGVERYRESHRDARGVNWMEELTRNLRFAVRSLRRAPAFTAAATIVLALGIGAAVAIFTVIDAVMLRPLPYSHAERLVEVLPGQNANIALADALGQGTPALAASTGLSIWDLTLTGQGEAAVIETQCADAAFFDVFGVKPFLGRPFRADERDLSRSDVVVLSYGLWQRRFGGDPSVIGRRIALDGNGHRMRTVIGVMPRGFTAPLAPPGSDIEAWAPLSRPPGETIATDSSWYVNHIVGRLRAGATVATAASQIRTTMERLSGTYPAYVDAEVARTAGAMSLLDSMVGDVRTPLLIMLAAVGLVLLLACANLANLLLARGERRRQEFAVRAALGAGRRRLVRDQLVESFVLALVGGVAGVVVARVVLSAVGVGELSGLPRVAALSLDWRVLVFAAGICALCVLAFGLLPALRASSGELKTHLGAGTRSAGPTRYGRRVGFALIAAETAIAMVLVTGAALLLSSLRALASVDPGMRVDHVLATRLEPPSESYGGQRGVRFYEELLGRLRALPGVAQAGAVQLLPFTHNNWAFPYLAEDHAPGKAGRLPAASFRVVTPGYFRAVGVPVLRGRDVEAGDRADAPAVGLINHAMAEQLWPGERAVGKVIRLFGNRPFTVIGVVGDVHQHALRDAPDPEMYVPLAQFPVTGMVVMVRARGEPSTVLPDVRRTIQSVGNDVPIADMRPLSAVLDQSLARERFFTSILSFFGILALTLGAVGVYGVMAYAVGARRGEFSLRMALGATASGVMRAALATGLAPLAAGLAVGVLAAFATTRLLAGLLYGVGPMDPRVVVAAALVLIAVAVVAIGVPVRRAGRSDPVQALRTD